MANETKTSPSTASSPSVLHKIWTKIRPARATGVTCEHCGWNGAPEELVKAPRMNEDGVVYQIQACPSCHRNGGLVFHN